MEKIRVSVYFRCGIDKDGNLLVSCSRDDLADVRLGLLDESEDIKVEIIEISDNAITLRANGEEYPLKKGERVEFDCCTGYYGGVSSDNQYFFVISLEDEAINSYEQTKIQLHKTIIKK